MSLQIASHQIQRVLVVEDNSAARDSYQYTLEDMDLEPILEKGPLSDLETYISSVAGRYDAAICDHHLTESGYAAFNGARLVAEMNLRCKPAVLCTMWERAGVDEIRRFRKNIPCLLKPNELNLDNFRRALTVCIDELNGCFLPERFASRTLVRVEDIDKDNVDVILPGWNPQEVVRLSLQTINRDVRSLLKVGARLHAHVNIGAERQEELYFDQWEGK